MRYRTKINGMKITTPGEYRIKLKLQDGNKLKEVADLPLEVKFEVKFD